MSARILPSLVPETELPSSAGQSEWHAKPISFSASKVIAEGFIKRTGLDGVEVAGHLGIHKSTLFGKRDPRAMNRGFTGEELEKLQRLAIWVEGNSEFSRSA